jgi:hypothetical protein
MAGALGRCGLWLAVAVMSAATVSAQQDRPFDIDEWHEAVYGAVPKPAEDRGFAIGLYPGASAVLGTPNIVSGQANLFISVNAGSSFSLYLGYGEEWGNSADARIYTFGWGGVRELEAARRQRGFYGKFLRYREWDSDNHGLHHGLSVGSESGVGYLSLAFEFGAARSGRDHWIVVAQVSLKVALPILIPLD